MSPHTVTEKYNEINKSASEKINSVEKETLIMIGTATCGLAAGAKEVKDAFEKEINDNGISAKVMEVGCIGHCYAEPLVIIKKEGFPPIAYSKVDEGLVNRLVNDFLLNNDPCYEYALAALEPNDEFPTFQDYPRGASEEKIILKDCGLIDPEDINQYIAGGGYGALAKALTLTPDEILQEIKDANLRGRGGAGFPAGIKWESAMNAEADTKYVICNGDEGDPGAFMDRNILESNPHLVIEGLIIAAHTIGASEGFFYIRAEYPLAVQRIEHALKEARDKGLLGKSIMESGFDFDIKIFQGSGAFVCGESSALVESMEGKTGMPQTRPPRLAHSGFRGKPTVLNNVKTFCYVPYIINNGAETFKNSGTENTPGTAVFSVVGKVVSSGLAEVPMGMTLRQLIYEIADGIPNEKEFKAVQIGGPSGGCLPESALDVPVDFDSLDSAGAIMGSGGLVVLDEDDCMVSVAHFFQEFTQHESCGKCTFCRLGTKHMLDMLAGICRGEGDENTLTKLKELAEDVRDGSLCNLGKTAPNPVLTTLRYFIDEYKAHIFEKRCPALVCKDLMVYFIEPKKCSKLCNACVGSCPTEAIYTRDDGLKAIDQEKCVKCDNCMKACPPEYLAVVKLSPPSLLEEREGKK